MEVSKNPNKIYFIFLCRKDKLFYNTLIDLVVKILMASCRRVKNISSITGLISQNIDDLLKGEL